MPGVRGTVRVNRIPPSPITVPRTQPAITSVTLWSPCATRSALISAPDVSPAATLQRRSTGLDGPDIKNRRTGATALTPVACPLIASKPLPGSGAPHARKATFEAATIPMPRTNSMLHVSALRQPLAIPSQIAIAAAAARVNGRSPAWTRCSQNMCAPLQRRMATSVFQMILRSVQKPRCWT